MTRATSRNIVDTIIDWGEETLAYHTSRRATNGPIRTDTTTSYKSYAELFADSATVATTQHEESS